MNRNLTLSYITALTGSPDTVMEWRVIDDRNKGTQARNVTGTLDQQCENGRSEILVCVLLCGWDS